MRLIEKKAGKIGITTMVMMENAGNAVATFLVNSLSSEELKAESDKRLKALFVAGVGNNGGDTFVAARHLAYWKHRFDIAVALIGDPQDIHSKEANTNWKILLRIHGIKRFVISNVPKIRKLRTSLSNADVIIVGIFGTGFNGRPRELQRLTIDAINGSKKALKVSVDVPSGLEADTGRNEYAVRSDVTVTLHAPKIGMLIDSSARQKCGRIIVANLGFPF
jgi:hydroxyethylthiazole kinase-like uncharacterized protein yjeF